MTEYLIAFNDEWVPDLTLAELREKSKTAQALVAEMKAAGVFVYTNGGLIPETPVFSVDPSSGEPLSRTARTSRARSTSAGPGGPAVDRTLAHAELLGDVGYRGAVRPHLDRGIGQLLRHTRWETRPRPPR
jgi:hypothetical protein